VEEKSGWWAFASLPSASLSHTIHSLLLHSFLILSLSLSRTLTKETALVSRGSDWLHDESTDTPNTMRQQHGSHLLKALHTHRLKVELVHHQTYRHICSVELPTQLINKMNRLKQVDNTGQTCRSASICASITDQAECKDVRCHILYDDRCLAWVGGIRQWCHLARQKKNSLSWFKLVFKNPQNPYKTSQKTSKPEWFKQFLIVMMPSWWHV